MTLTTETIKTQVSGEAWMKQRRAEIKWEWYSKLAEDLRQLAAGSPPVELKLPETVLGHGEAVGLKEARVGEGKDMGNAKFVADYRGRFTVNHERGEAEVRCLRIGRKPAEEYDDTGQRQ